MLNHAIVAAFLATSAVSFGVEAAQAESTPCEVSQPAADRAPTRAGRPLGTVDTSPREGCQTPRIVRA